MGGAATLPAAARPARYYRGHRVRQVASGGAKSSGEVSGEV